MHREVSYAQARIQSRYGARVDTGDWLRLHNIHDLDSYLQTAQQTPLRPWVLGISSTHSGHEVELTLRRKYRHHVDEVSSWMPLRWRASIGWIKAFADLPSLHYLAAGHECREWMKSDTALSRFATDDLSTRLQAMRDAGYRELLVSWQQHGTMLPGWLAEWQKRCADDVSKDKGLLQLQKLLMETMKSQAADQEETLVDEHELLADALRVLFRRYAFRPAAVFAYLAMIATDLHRLRGDIVQRLYLVDRPAWKEVEAAV